MKNTLLLSLGVACVLAVPAQAAILTGSAITEPEIGVDLTDLGTVDWALWNTTDAASVGSHVATNTKSGGADIISAITAVGGSGSVRGVSGAVQTYSYTDGTSPATATDATSGFVINSQLDSMGAGITLSITGSSSQLYVVDIWTAGFRARGDLTASLSGADDVVLSSRTFGDVGVAKESSRFTISFQPDSDTDLLNLSFLMSADTGSNAHVGIQAITVTAVPEPSSYAFLLGLVGFGFALNGMRRRR